MRTMTRTLTGAVVLCGVSTASADGERLFFEVSNHLSPHQPTAVVTLWAGFDTRDYAMASVVTNVEASDGNWFALELIGALAGPGTRPGIPTSGGRIVENIVAGQLHGLGGISGDPSNPIAFWRAEIEVFDFTPREIELSTLTSRFDVYLGAGSASSQSRLAGLEDASGVIRVVPAPGVPSAVVLCIALAARRRRG